MRLTMASLVSELTSTDGRMSDLEEMLEVWSSSWGCGRYDLIRALLFCCRSVIIVRKFAHIKFSMVSVVPILPIFVSIPTPFLLTVFFLGTFV